MNNTGVDTLFQHSPKSYFKYALTLFKEKRFSDALQFIDTAIVFSHNSPFYIYQKIRFLYESGVYKDCSQFIVSQLEYLYKHASLYILCRSLDYLQKMNHYDLDYFTKMLKYHHIPYCLASSYSELLITKHKPFFSLANKAMFQDDYPLCLCYCKLYLKLHPITAEIYYMQAYCHHLLGNLLTAKSDYLEYLNLRPKDAQAYINIAFISMEIGDYDTAITYCQKASDIEPDNIHYLLYLGECYSAAKKLEEAAATYEYAAKKKPGDLQIYFNLSHIYKRMCKNRLSRRYMKIIKKSTQKLDTKKGDVS